MKSLKSGLSANGQTCSKFQSDNILNINSDDISIIRFEGIQVRIVKINNNPWFVAKDVCDALEIINSRDALKALDLDEKNTVALNYGIQGNPNRQVIAESGFYKLIARSRKATTKDTFAQMEFLVSIKKGSQPATLGDVDIEYRASENINTSLLLWYGKYQPLGSIPRDCNSFLIIRLIQADTDASPSCSNAVFIPSSSEGSTRKAICLFPLPDILMVDTWFTPDYIEIESQVYCKCIPKTMPRSALTLTGHLITTDNEAIEVTMSQHITALTGRNSHTQNIVFIWRFAECQQNKTTYHLVIAHTENEARSMLPNIFLVFTARIRVGWVMLNPTQLTQNAEKAFQIEIISLLVKTHERELELSETLAILSLIKRLAGEISSSLFNSVNEDAKEVSHD